MLRGMGRRRGACCCTNALVLLLIVAVLFSPNFLQLDARPVTSSSREELQGPDLKSMGAVEYGIEKGEVSHALVRMQKQGRRMLLMPDGGDSPPEKVNPGGGPPRGGSGN